MNFALTSSYGDYLPLLAVAATGFIFCAGFYPFYIKWLKSKQVEQFIREEGPQSHAVKAKTPTMGGIGFILGVFVATGFMIYRSGIVVSETMDATYQFNMLLMISLSITCAFACAALGIADDYGKVSSKSNKGLSARFRLFTEFGLGLILATILLFFDAPIGTLVLQSRAGHPLDIFVMPDMLARAYGLILVPFLVAATSNAVNLHDGMDGLAAGTSSICFAALSFMLFVCGKSELAWVASAASGSLIAFLLYNRYPARVFMGDTGSLFIGGLMASLVVCGGLTLWFIPLSIIYIIESISVMAQVTYFKLSKPFQPEKPMSAPSLALYKLTHRLPGDGKRLLRMAPIHHHFEAIAAEKGKPEWQVVICFWLIQLVIALAVCFAFSHPL